MHRMALAKKLSMKRSNSVIKSAIRALQRSLPWPSTSARSGGDVKEGHFAVVAVHDTGEPKRFVVSLSCLSHPVFLRLLDKAEEEFGFAREGTISLPCRPIELERIIGEL